LNGIFNCIFYVVGDSIEIGFVDGFADIILVKEKARVVQKVSKFGGSRVLVDVVFLVYILDILEIELERTGYVWGY